MANFCRGEIMSPTIYWQSGRETERERKKEKKKKKKKGENRAIWF